MKAILSVAALCILSTAPRALDVKSVAPGTWVNVTGNVPNAGNGAYEDDFNCDPWMGLSWVGPGHRGTPQDNHWYIYDPLAASHGVPDWTNTLAATPPPKKCLSHFCISTSDEALMAFGGSTGHQNSIGQFTATYDSVMDKLYTAYDIYYYSIPQNKWRGMKAPGKRHPGASGLLAHHRFKYDPIHDVAVVHGGDNSGTQVLHSWVYNLHYNEWTEFITSQPGAREMYAATLDTRRGLFYMMGGGTSHWGTYIPDMWKLDLDLGQWQQITTNVPPGNSSYVISMAYDPHDDLIYYLEGMTGYKLHVYDVKANQWSSVTTTGTTPSTVGRLTFNSHFNLLALLGGSSGSDGRVYDGLWFYRPRAHDLDSLKAYEALTPVADISTNGGSVALSWKSVAGATYNVYRGDAKPYPKNFVKLNGAPLSATSYNDASAVTGQWYSYRVSALVSGVESEKSRHLYTRPGRPLDVAASVESVNQVVVSWMANPENDIVGYNVYRARGVQMFNTSFLYTKLNASPVAGTQFTDNVDLSDRIARAYVVTAVNAFGCESGYSPTATTFPQPPQWVRTASQSANALIYWQAPERTKIQGVNIYPGGTYTTNYAPVNGSTFVTTSPYTASGGSTGLFSVRAVNVLNQLGFLSDELGPNNTLYTTGAGPLPAFDISKYGNELPPLSVQAAARGAVEPLSIGVFPNPSRAGAVLRVAGSARIASLRIFDCRGRCVARESNHSESGNVMTFQCGSLAPGLYFLEAAGAGSISEKAKLVVLK